jgi:hypothetical protein
MGMFSTAGGGDYGPPPDSFIQVLTVAEDWDESTLNWNNAPLAKENISGTWVYPPDEPTPGYLPFHWDVSRAVAEAYELGEPLLRLALYSVDGERHSGKYFWSSDFNSANPRPTLQVAIGKSSIAPQPSKHIFTYLPQVLSSTP